MTAMNAYASLQLDDVVSGLRFPEGPVALPDGSIALVEMFGPRVTRVWPNGRTEVIAEVPGGPNGAALGPDGALYLCNNGGCFTPVTVGALMVPGPFDPTRYLGGRIQRLDLTTGELTDLYTHCNGRPLRAPNDMVFDAHGGFYFTDHGIRDHAARTSDLTAIYYAKADGSYIAEVVYPVDSPNGVGLSPHGDTLYWAETHTGRVFRRHIVEPGVVSPVSPGDTSVVLCGLPGYQLFDSLAVDSAGNVCVATLVHGGITVIAPNGDIAGFVPVDDRITTNICFAGPDLTTAYITGGSTGRLLRTSATTPWPQPGLAQPPPQ
jgi:gluconolactonase